MKPLDPRSLPAPHPAARNPRIEYRRVVTVRIVGDRLVRGCPYRPVETAEIPVYARGLPGGGVEVGWGRVPVRVLP